LLRAGRPERRRSPGERSTRVFSSYPVRVKKLTPRLHVKLRYPRPAARFEARVFGPFLVIRSRRPTRTIREFLLQTQAVQLVGQSLLLGDSDINLLTVERALGLRGLDAGGAR
jgi:hypothetical protein